MSLFFHSHHAKRRPFICALSHTEGREAASAYYAQAYIRDERRGPLAPLQLSPMRRAADYFRRCSRPAILPWGVGDRRIVARHRSATFSPSRQMPARKCRIWAFYFRVGDGRTGGSPRMPPNSQPFGLATCHEYFIRFRRPRIDGMPARAMLSLSAGTRPLFTM